MLALDGAGHVTAAQLYAPYGGLRYISGAMPTTKGFTGKRADAATGLDYYGARYYDAVAGQFTSADTVASGRSPYAYVRGNPETLTDPTGHRYECPNGCGGGSGGGGSGSGSGAGGHGRCDPANPANCGNPGRKPPATCTPTGGAKACLGTGASSDSCNGACQAQKLLNADGNQLLFAGAEITLLGLVIIAGGSC